MTQDGIDNSLVLWSSKPKPLREFDDISLLWECTLVQILIRPQCQVACPPSDTKVNEGKSLWYSLLHFA